MSDNFASWCNLFGRCRILLKHNRWRGKQKAFKTINISMTYLDFQPCYSQVILFSVPMFVLQHFHSREVENFKSFLVTTCLLINSFFDFITYSYKIKSLRKSGVWIAIHYIGTWNLVVWSDRSTSPLFWNQSRGVKKLCEGHMCHEAQKGLMNSQYISVLVLQTMHYTAMLFSTYSTLLHIFYNQAFMKTNLWISKF